MTNTWLLSKQSMKGMDVLAAATDALYALELKEPKKHFEESNYKESLERCHQLLERLAMASKAQISPYPHPKDLFMLKVAEGLEENLGLPPSELYEQLEKSSSELEKGSASAQTIKVLESVSDVAIKLASRSVGAISTSVR